MILNKDNICDYLSRLDFTESKIVNIRNVRNFCATLDTTHGRILVKQEGRNSSTFAQVSIRNELRFYELINEELSQDIKQLIPRLFYINSDDKVLLIEFLAEHKNFNLGEDSKNYKISNDLGIQLATLHNLKLDSHSNVFEKTNIENYFRSFRTITPELYNSGGPLFAKCVELMQLYPDLNEEIGNFEKEFKWDCVIHGDLKTDNILVKNIGSEVNIKFIDWELVGIGDRHLDLGYVIGSYLLWWVENMRFGESFESANDERMMIAKEHIYHFILGYQGALNDKVTLDYIKLTRFASIFLLNVFYSKSLFKIRYSKQDVMILEIARKMLVTPKAVYPEIFMKTIMQNYEKYF